MNGRFLIVVLLVVVGGCTSGRNAAELDGSTPAKSGGQLRAAYVTESNILLDSRRFR